MRKTQNPSTHPRHRAQASFQMLRPRETATALGISPTTLWRHSKDPDFPQKYRVSQNGVAWREEEILAWLKAREIAVEALESDQQRRDGDLESGQPS